MKSANTFLIILIITLVAVITFLAKTSRTIDSGSALASHSNDDEFNYNTTLVEQSSSSGCQIQTSEQALQVALSQLSQNMNIESTTVRLISLTTLADFQHSSLNWTSLGVNPNDPVWLVAVTSSSNIKASDIDPGLSDNSPYSGGYIALSPSHGTTEAFGTISTDLARYVQIENMPNEFESISCP